MEKTIKIKGMHCNACEMLIKDSLEELEGVNSAKISFKDGTGKISYEDSIISLEKIKKTILEEGYEPL